MIKRREFITGLGGVVAWPLASRAQQRSLPVIGYLSSRSAEAEIPILSEFRQGLAAVDIFEGRNVEIDFALLTAKLIAYRPWRPNWSAANLLPSSPSRRSLQSRPGGLLMGRFRWCSTWVAIRPSSGLP